MTPSKPFQRPQPPATVILREAKRSRRIHESKCGSCDCAQDDTFKGVQDDTFKGVQDDTLRASQDDTFRQFLVGLEVAIHFAMHVQNQLLLIFRQPYVFHAF
jgi:hypothetical protein